VRSYQEAFDSWAQVQIDEWSAKHPCCPPYDYATFDGCSWGLDLCRACCLLHDLAYHYATDRRTADRELRDAFWSLCAQEDRLGWCWWFIGWLYWLAVRVFGWIPWHRRRFARSTASLT
jgi:hypothetical protein